MEAIKQFLVVAQREQEVVDLRTRSGYEFKKVRVNQIQDGCVELLVVENKISRFYVVVVDSIEWAVRSGH